MIKLSHLPQEGTERDKQLSFKHLQRAAEARGASIVTVLRDAGAIGKDQKALRRWISNGFHGQMRWMERGVSTPDQARALFPALRSLIVLAIPYPGVAKQERRPLHGKVARYAWGRDYHRVIKKVIKQIFEELSIKPESYRVVTDSAPLLERAIAVQAGVGFAGKNTMIIRPKLGSYFFLAEVLTAYDLSRPPLNIVEEGCGSCARCLNACPTNAFSSAHVLNANRCISYLTIEKRGALSHWERRALGEWVFGCDVCQEVCPFNHARAKRSSKGSCEAEKLAPEFSFKTSFQLSLKEILAIRSNDEFVSRFAGTPLMRAKREGLLRNAACVAANTGAKQLLVPLLRAATKDESEIIQQHAIWALGELGSELSCDRRNLLKQKLVELLPRSSPAVRGEIQWSLRKLEESVSLCGSGQG